MKKRWLFILLALLLVIVIGVCIVLAKNGGTLLPQPTPTNEPTNSPSPENDNNTSITEGTGELSGLYELYKIEAFDSDYSKYPNGTRIITKDEFGSTVMDAGNVEDGPFGFSIKGNTALEFSPEVETAIFASGATNPFNLVVSPTYTFTAEDGQQYTENAEDIGAVCYLQNAENGISYTVKYDADGITISNSKSQMGLPIYYYKRR